MKKGKNGPFKRKHDVIWTKHQRHDDIIMFFLPYTWTKFRKRSHSNTSLVQRRLTVTKVHTANRSLRKNKTCKTMKEKIDFNYLVSLQEHLQRELKDSELVVSASTTEGRVLLEIPEDMLDDFVNHLLEPVDNMWFNQKHLTEQVMSQRKGQLKEADHSPSNKSRLHTPELDQVQKLLEKAKRDLEQQYSINKDQSLEMEKMKGEMKSLQKELEAKKEELQRDRLMLSKAKTNVELELESYLQIEVAQTEKLKKELSTMQEALHNQQEESKKALSKCLSDLEEQRDRELMLTAQLEYSSEDIRLLKIEHDTVHKMLQNACKDVGQQYDINKDQSINMERMNGEIKSLQEELEAEKEELQKYKLTISKEKTNVELELESFLQVEVAQTEKLKEELEKSEQHYAAQLEMQEKVHKSIMADMKKHHEDQLASGSLQWQQDRDSLLEKLDEQMERNISLRTALMECEQKKEDMSSLLQDRESLQETLQEKEQEWKDTESSMRKQVEELENQIAKKKRRKWYRKLF